jgi:hypothetical protein
LKPLLLEPPRRGILLPDPVSNDVAEPTPLLLWAGDGVEAAAADEDDDMVLSFSSWILGLDESRFKRVARYSNPTEYIAC